MFRVALSIPIAFTSLFSAFPVAVRFQNPRPPLLFFDPFSTYIVSFFPQLRYTDYPPPAIFVRCPHALTVAYQLLSPSSLHATS
jgi:hypothetical protein